MHHSDARSDKDSTSICEAPSETAISSAPRQSGWSAARRHDARQIAAHQQQARQSHRKIDEERRAPAIVLTQKTAERRPERIGHPECAREQNLPAQAHHRIGKQIGNRRKAGADQHAAANALQRAKQHELRHAAGHAAQHGRQREQHDRRDDRRLAAKPVAQASEDRHGDDRSQQIGCRNPRIQIEAIEFGDDGRQRGADHGLVDGDHHHDRGQPEHGEQRLSERAWRAGNGRDGQLTGDVHRCHANVEATPGAALRPVARA